MISLDLRVHVARGILLFSTNFRIEVRSLYTAPAGAELYTIRLNANHDSLKP